MQAGGRGAEKAIVVLIDGNTVTFKRYYPPLDDRIVDQHHKGHVFEIQIIDFQGRAFSARQIAIKNLKDML